MNTFPLSREDRHDVIDAYWEAKIKALPGMEDTGVWFHLMEEWREDKLRTEELQYDEGL